MQLAPIIIFAFNRPDSLRNTIQSLLENEEAKNSDLYVFVDGARAYKNGEQDKVNAVQTYTKNIKGFKSVHYSFSNKNKGLGNSIIQGVTQVIKEYGKAIVLEDDLVFATNFLYYMNQGLEKYKEEKKVFSICGYSNKVKVPKEYTYDTYFCTRSSSWGWGTWADRWSSVDWELKDWNRYAKMSNAFNQWGGSDCFRMLRSVKEGWGNSWAIRFCFSQFLQNKLSLFPIISKVKNNGFDGEGTNCKKWSRFKYDFDIDGNKNISYPDKIYLNKQLYKSAMSYNTILIRLYSRLMYIIHN